MAFIEPGAQIGSGITDIMALREVYTRPCQDTVKDTCDIPVNINNTRSPNKETDDLIT